MKYLIFLILFGVSCCAQQYFTTSSFDAAQDVKNTADNLEDEENAAPATSAQLREYEDHPDTFPTNKYLSVALGYICETNILQSEKMYKLILDIKPKSIRSNRGLANCYLLLGQYDLAVNQFRRGVAWGDSLSLLGLANAHRASLQYGEIASLIPELINIKDKSVDAGLKHEAANILLDCAQNAQLFEGKNKFVTVIETFNDDFILSQEETARLAISYFRKNGQLDRANRLEVSLENEVKVNTYNKQGIDRYKAGKFLSAIDDFNLAIALCPTNVTALYNRASVELALKKWNLAILDYSKVIKMGPTNEFVFNNRGNARFMLSDVRGAINDYKTAIEINTNYFDAHVNLAGAQTYLRQWAMAKENFRIAIQINPKVDYPHIGLWVAQSMNGDTARAVEELKTYCETQQPLVDRVWTIHIIMYLLKLEDEGTLQKVAVNSERKCAAFYYMGIKHLVAGEIVIAKKYFQMAVATKAIGVSEYLYAEAELKHLD